jgi:putative hydrolase of the HAD superfamily
VDEVVAKKEQYLFLFFRHALYMKDIKNIIFDLGGVIINLDQQRTIYQFNRLSDVPFETFYNTSAQSGLFDEFDKGRMSTEDFLGHLKKELRYSGHTDALLQAWNAMLLDVPEHRLDVLINAKSNYSTYLLSNTCEPHIASFEEQLYQEHGVKNFEDYFDKVYYSCRMGMRKPDKEIFETVLRDNTIRPEETVFIDDSAQHVKGAGECGINAYLLPKNMEIEELLKDLKLL